MSSSPSTFGQAFNRTTGDSLGGLARQQQSQARTTREIAYKAIVACSEQNIYVDAWLPETVGVDVAANYEAPFAQGIGSINEKFGALAQFIGMNLTTQAMTAQIWQGGSFINFQIPFIFQAETSAEVDVMQPIKKLLRLTMPSDPSGGGILEAPGPHFDIRKLAEHGGEQATQALNQTIGYFTSPQAMLNTKDQIVSNPLGAFSEFKGAANNVARKSSTALVNSVVNNISLSLGQFMFFPSVVVTDVSPTFDVLLSPDGKPLRATVNVGFRTFYIPTQNDIELMFTYMQVEDLGQNF